MLIWKSIAHIINVLELPQNDLCHFVQSSLHTGTIICRKSRQCRILDTFKCSIKRRDRFLHIIDIFEQTPSVTGSNLRRKDSVVDIRKKSIFIFDVAVEGGSSGLEDQQILQSRGDLEPLSAYKVRFRHTDIFPITKEGVFVRLSVDENSSPFMLNDRASSTRNMFVRSREMRGDNWCK